MKLMPIIDGDILCYRVGFACNEETEKVAIRTMADMLEELVFIELSSNIHVGYLTGKDNYRHDIAKTKPYKGNRKDAPRPVHLHSLREYLITAWDFRVANGQEADDAIGIHATLTRDNSIIVSIDKDLDMIPGHHYNPVKKDHYYVNDKVALKNFYRQILTGDKVDNIEGLRGIGPKKADKILGDFDTDLAMYEAVLKAYDGDAERVLENGQLLWIRRKEGELWQPPTPSST
jgi:DNA polymerase I